jgi:hypothetical protein
MFAKLRLRTERYRLRATLASGSDREIGTIDALVSCSTIPNSIRVNGASAMEKVATSWLQ